MKENLLIIKTEECSFSLILLYVFILDIVRLRHLIFYVFGKTLFM